MVEDNTPVGTVPGTPEELLRAWQFSFPETDSVPLLQGIFQRSALSLHGDILLGGRQGCLVLALQVEKCYHDGSAAVLMEEAPDWS